MQIRDEKDKILAVEMMGGASDRAAAIVAIAYLDDKLTKAIKAHLVPDGDTLNRLFKPSGPLGPMGNKLDVGFLIGLYSKEFRDDLQIMTRARNSFAHWARPVTFGHKEIRQYAEALGFHARMFGEMQGWPKPPLEAALARYVFISTADVMASHLEAMAENPAHPKVL